MKKVSKNVQVARSLHIASDELSELMNDPATSPTLRLAILGIVRRVNEAKRLLPLPDWPVAGTLLVPCDDPK